MQFWWPQPGATLVPPPNPEGKQHRPPRPERASGRAAADPEHVLCCCPSVSYTVAVLTVLLHPRLKSSWSWIPAASSSASITCTAHSLFLPRLTLHARRCQPATLAHSPRTPSLSRYLLDYRRSHARRPPDVHTAHGTRHTALERGSPASPAPRRRNNPPPARLKPPSRMTGPRLCSTAGLHRSLHRPRALDAAHRRSGVAASSSP
jgi:hypothetical protein